MMPFFGHIGIGLIFARITGLNPLLIIIGCVIPDLDIILFFFRKTLFKLHRTFTHSLLFISILFSISFFIESFIPILVGVLSHFLIDGIFQPSIPLFYPSKWKPPSIKLGESIKTDGSRFKVIDWRKWLWSSGFAIELLSVLVGLTIFFQN